MFTMAFVAIVFGLFASGVAVGRATVYHQLSQADQPKLLESNENVVRGAVSELSQSIWDAPEDWVRADESKIWHKHSGIAIWIGDGQDGVKVIGAISLTDLWGEEKEMLWEAAKFFESNQISNMLQAPSVKLPDEMKKGFFKTGEKIGRQYMFDEKGQVVPVNP